ncbi:MAG: DUF938 domain-containing protein [Pseudomonadota bacterium]
MTDENAAYPKASTGKPVALEARAEEADGRRFSPSIARNRDVVRNTFLDHMPRAGHVLEIASGTGEHGAYIASACPELTWQYSDIDAESRASQAAWCEVSRETARLLAPVILDTTQSDWASSGAHFPVDAIFCANMIHIAPFAATEGLLAGAGRHLRSGGRLMLYGPFSRNGEIAPSNARFSEDLKRRDPSWGVRDLDKALVPIAKTTGLDLRTVVDMPANNLSVIFEKA